MMKYDDQDQFSLPRKSEVTEFQSRMDLMTKDIFTSPFRKGEGDHAISPEHVSSLISLFLLVAS